MGKEQLFFFQSWVSASVWWKALLVQSWCRKMTFNHSVWDVAHLLTFCNYMTHLYVQLWILLQAKEELVAPEVCHRGMRVPLTIKENH